MSPLSLLARLSGAVAVLVLPACVIHDVPDEALSGETADTAGDVPFEEQGPFEEEEEAYAPQAEEAGESEAVGGGILDSVPSFGPELHYEGQFSYKGGTWGKSKDYVFGGSCRPGYVRDSAQVYRLSGKGSCSLRGWYSGDMSDCRIRVHLGVPAFKRGTCAWQVYASQVAYFDYTASNTNNAQQNTTGPNIQLKGGETLTVATCKLPGVVAAGNTFLRVLNSQGQSVAHNNNGSGCGTASYLVYTVPSGSDAWYEIKAGCSSSTSCSGRVGYVVQPAPQ